MELAYKGCAPTGSGEEETTGDRRVLGVEYAALGGQYGDRAVTLG